MKYLPLVVFVILAPLLVGFTSCGTKDTATDGDRMLSDQNQKAAKVIGTAVVTAEAVPGVPNEALTALSPIGPAAADIDANAGQQLAAWGPPENPQPYSAKVSASSREQQKEEHESSPLWPIAIGVGTTLLGVLLRSTGLGAIPFLGPILARVSPRLAHGAGKADAPNVGLQEVLKEVRAELDKRLPELKAAAIAKGLPAALIDKIPSGQVIIDQATKILTRRGLLEVNDQILERARKDTVGVLDVAKLSAAAQPPASPPPDPQPPETPRKPA